MQEVVKIIAATGHRPPKIGGYGQAAGCRLIAFATGYLRDAQPEQTISGMALGWDMAFARATLDLGIPLIAAVPFEGQEAKWPADSQRQYSNLLARATAVHVVSPGGYSAAKMQVRNEWMVDNCTRVAALWDGSAGGTGNCIPVRPESRQAVDNLWADWQATAPLEKGRQ